MWIHPDLHPIHYTYECVDAAQQSREQECRLANYLFLWSLYIVSSMWPVNTLSMKLNYFLLSSLLAQTDV